MKPYAKQKLKKENRISNNASDKKIVSNIKKCMC